MHALTGTCRDISSESMTADKLLFKYSRQFTQDGVKMFNKR